MERQGVEWGGAGWSGMPEAEGCDTKLRDGRSGDLFVRLVLQLPKAYLSTIYSSPCACNFRIL